MSDEAQAPAPATEPETLRGAIEKAFSDAEVSAAPADETPPVEPVAEPEPTEPVKEPEPSKEGVVEPPVAEDTDEPVQGEEQQPAEQTPQVNAAPKSWKTSIRNQYWDKLPPEVQQEVIRREKDMTRVLGESATARQLVNQFQEIARPYEARMRANNVNPLQAVERLLNTDHVLSSAPPVQRAQLMAKLIKDYGIDIRELDSALAGEPAADPMQAKMGQMLDQRLGPLNQFVEQQRQQQQYLEQQRAAKAQQQIIEMGNDTVKFPHFEQVREQMADLVDFYAAREQFFPLEQIYARAVAMDPELGPAAIQNQVKAAQLASAKAQHAKAQRAQAASLSVSSSKTGVPMARSSNGADDLRSTIEQAWATHSGR